MTFLENAPKTVKIGLIFGGVGVLLQIASLCLLYAITDGLNAETIIKQGGAAIASIAILIFIALHYDLARMFFLARTAFSLFDFVNVLNLTNAYQESLALLLSDLLLAAICIAASIFFYLNASKPWFKHASELKNSPDETSSGQ